MAQTETTTNAGGLLETFDLLPLDPWMILASALLFMCFWKILERFFVRPYIELIEHRESKTSRADELASDKMGQAKQIEAEVESQLHNVRVEAVAKKAEVTRTAEERAAKLIRATEKNAAQEIKDARHALDTEIDSLRKQVLAQAEEMAEAIVDRIVRPTSSGASSSSPSKGEN